MTTFKAVIYSFVITKHNGILNYRTTVHTDRIVVKMFLSVCFEIIVFYHRTTGMFY